MTSSSVRLLVQLTILVLLLNMVLARYEHPRTIAGPNQRSAGSNFAYAWFTRDIHDNDYSDNEINRPDIDRMKFLKKLLNKD
ncbi:hypothetical protein I4U23_025357 [Adineta vaga]|nr:hypothetical protein I4U23_025357 [Adineta vaga]